GLVVRGRWRLNRSFAVHIVVVFATTALPCWWPARFFVADSYMATQGVIAILKFLIVLELSAFTFRNFHGAESTVRKASSVILAATALSALAVVWESWPSNPYPAFVGQLHSRLSTGTIWLMATMLALARWYRVPVHPFLTSIITAYALYLAA